MPKNTVALQIPTAPVVSIFRIVDHMADIRPRGMAFGSLTYSDLKEACLSLRDSHDVAAIDIGDPLVAVPKTLGNLTNGAVIFSERSVPLHWQPGELLLPDQSRGPELDHIRLPQERLVRSAQALAARYRFTDTDQIYVDGPLDDPGTWLALTAAMYAGAAITWAPEEATIVWSLNGNFVDFGDKTRVVHLQTGLERLSDLQRQHPDTTFVTGLTLAAGGGLPVCSDPRDPPDTVLSTLGRPLGDTEVMIVDPVTGLDRLLYETGEIWLRRGSTIVGYTSGRAALADAGFLPTGLLGHLDCEGRVVIGDAVGVSAS